jgi:hypothetical protein
VFSRRQGGTSTIPTTHERRGGNYAAFCGYRYYGGHYGYDIFRVVSDGHDAITNFREPAARLLSLYNYYRLDVTLPDDPSQLDYYYPVVFAQQVDFHCFVSTNDPRIEIQHPQPPRPAADENSAWSPGSAGDLTHTVALLEGCRGSTFASNQNYQCAGAKRYSAISS